MKNRKILLIHGNPGVPEDFKTLRSRITLPEGYEWFPVVLPAGESNILTALDKAIPDEEGLNAIAFSFGCYALLKWAQSRGRKLKTVIFLNPTLGVDHPVSALKQMIINLPVLGSKILAGAAPKLAAEFISKTFAPQEAQPAEAERMLQYLSKGEIWAKASAFKSFQQSNPLSGSFAGIIDRLIVIRGGKDTAVPWESQEKIMKEIGLGANEILIRPDVGHSVPWNIDQKVVEIMQREFDKPAGQAATPVSIKAEERKKVRIGYQPGSTEKNNVLGYLESHLVNFPDRVALRWVNTPDIQKWDGSHNSPLPHNEITYAQFNGMIDTVALGLRKLGIEKGDRVIIFLPMNTLMYTAMFAVQRLGAIAVFLDSWARSSHLGASASCAQPKAMISHKAAFDLIREVPEFSTMPLWIIAGPGNDGSFSAQLEKLLETPGTTELVAVESEETALITFTTGSSGTPKGANRTHRFLCAQHESLSQVVPYGPTDKDMPAFPIFSLNNLASGVTTILPAINLAAPSERDSAAMVSQILHEKLTCTTLSPSMLNGVSAYCIANKIQLVSLRRVVTGGAPISRDNVADFKQVAPQSEVWVLYGSTVVEPMAHIEASEMLGMLPDPDPEIVEDGVNVGHVSDDLRYKFIKIVRENIDLKQTSWKELEVPTGEVGEFIVTGDHVCRDYYNNPEAFFKSKIQDDEGNVWHRTGDLARRDSKGYLWVVGRIHNVIERGDTYCFPVSAEVILKRIPQVKYGAFLGMPDQVLGSKTAVAIELNAGEVGNAALSKEIVRLFKKNKIPVDCIFVVDKIPMDPRHHSKVEYDQLRDSLIKDKTADLLAG